LNKIVQQTGLDLTQIDEILLAGASTLFPGLQTNLAGLVAPSTPVTAAIDPSQVIAIGCALQALHLSRLDKDLQLSDVLALADRDAETLSTVIGIAIPGDKSETLAAKLFEQGSALPSRRRVALGVASGAEKVGVELWEGKEDVKITKIPAPPAEDDESEPEEDEETKEVILKKAKFLGYVEAQTKGAKGVQLEVIVQKGGKVEARIWAEGQEESASTVEF
jgi:heat shock protein 1/8